MIKVGVGSKKHKTTWRLCRIYDRQFNPKARRI